ncbi:MAG: hypothetical protein ACQESK_08825 [Bacteroidota bacterium]
MKRSKLCLLLLLTSLLFSCGTKKVPNQAVHLHKNQLNLMDGFYEIVPYESHYSDDYTSLDKLFDMQIPINVRYVKLEFISEKELKVSYEIAGTTEEKIIKGKHKHGGFYLKKSWGAFGIPPFFWFQSNKGKRIFMGNDDNLIFDEFEDKSTMLFGVQNSTYLRKVFLYDRLYQNLYTN